MAGTRVTVREAPSVDGAGPWASSAAALGMPRGAPWPSHLFVDERGRVRVDNRPMPPSAAVAFREYGVRAAGAVLELTTEFHGTSPVPRGGRSQIVGFSKRSRRALFKFCAALPWEVLGASYFVTLTYPGEFPSDGRVVKRDLDTFRKALDRKCGGRARAVWKLEFQGRGAPHFHLALAYGGDVADLRTWVSRRWFEIVGSGDERHLRAGTQVQELRGNPAAYFAGYTAGCKHKSSKEYQNRVPEGFGNVGRFWGAWNIRPEWRVMRVSRDEWVQLRRLVDRFAESAELGMRPRTGRIQSRWWHLRDRSALLLVARLSAPGGGVMPRPLLT